MRNHLVLGEAVAMARMTNWQNLSDADLIEQLDEAKEEVFKLRFQIVTGRLDNTARLKQAKKEVARAMTELRMREIQAAEALEAQMQEAGSG
ncbi:50S ribosomal protein L29 [Candidatus Poriferisocius sp.]|uniref:50S ribosomal protein L29 n=1 Tax=Candidatus Poriferisocius sp. TaxID=3101276 RepID=UPI003B59FAE9